MTNLKKQVKELLDSASREIQQGFFWSQFDDEFSKWDSEEVILFKTAFQKSGIEYAIEDNYGGEDCGTEYWSVYKFYKGNEVVYVKFNGWYQSYNGSEYEEWYFAKPIPKSGFDFIKE